MSTPGQNSFSLLDMSGGVQTATSHLLKKRMEVYDSYNAAYNIRIGSACRRDGYEQVGQTIQHGNDSLYGGIYAYNVTSNRIITGINNAAGTNATLNYMDVGGYWTPILTNAAANTRFQCLNYLNDFYIAGKASGGVYQPLTMIDPTMTQQTYNTLNAPACKFIAQYAGQLYALNVQVNGVTYSDRMYQSSSALGVVTQVQNAITGWTTQIHVDSVHYLKVGMGIDIYGAQTSNLKYSNLQIVSVDKVGNNLGVSGQVLNINADDEVWITGRFGQLTTLWNTDYPTPQTSDWISMPSGLNETADITGWTVNNNRLFIFTKNSTIKWDGTNLTVLRTNVGCVSHETIQNIGSWTIWLHTSGVWGYNDTTGQYKKLSKAINPILKRVNPGNLKYASAVVNSENLYKLSLGQLMNATPADSTYLQTTSTSTSSTSTSSTSSSTSSTSTSSTSTSTVITTTSTSSTSSSISSTSSSTSLSTSTTTSVSFTTSTSSTSSSTSVSTTTSLSTSSSTSTSMTSTTTLATGKLITRICYDFDANIWWPELHTRESRFQFMHTMNGYTKPYFTDENGYLFRDETGLTDAGNSIPMMLEFGRTNCGTEQAKIFESALIDSERTRTGLMQYQLDGGNWETLGQITEDIGELTFELKNQKKIGHDINVRFTHNNTGDPPYFNGWSLYFNSVQSIVNEVSP